ncbi:hypothetical protein M9H77_07803 [Catharanthus roseus]|uniref:Uncharacterized protein n=1 Tax=Catharanthus roseus TaxID=4058 RepID=A0ACC0BVZ5_CATRO|nr:hypothetical protein M9H77_07803 [Catharanthus roseus]
MKVQVEEFKEASLGGFVALKLKEVECLESIATSRVHPHVHGSALAVEEKSSLNLPPMVFRESLENRCQYIIMHGMKNYRIEYDEYQNDHGAHTHQRYNFGTYGRNDCDGRWRYLRSMNAFYGNRSYGDEPLVERRVEDRRSMEKELGPILEHLSISLSLNPCSLCYEVSLEKLKSLLGSYTFQVSLIGDMCIIAFEGNIFLLVSSMTYFLSFHFSLAVPLMSSSVMFDPSCYAFGNLDDTSLVELNIVGFALEFDRNSR